ncbi:hypothetical protein PhCBS80983_g03576 [Powellomyces hirtus]|uniref:N-acetyltransferase domain-containing protein n=1 Tax=Powellomyces hirtus TaxID=109895 RepID=A0A507E3U6_9FUNG|nr:hypothetical protein PhCBS80983_g03576 [Powellomyces hirtus]
MTASEPLSLEEEYAMQATWAVDETKCTFIVLDSDTRINRVGRSAAFGGMIGDVNLYSTSRTTSEIEIMIAEESARGQRHGLTALLLMMHYATTQLGTTEFFAKVSDKNEASLALFRRTLGFVVAERSEFFKETTLVASLEIVKKALERLGEVTVEEFDDEEKVQP